MPARRQTGVALLTVLLVVFLATTAAVSLTSIQQLAIRRSTVLLHHQQAQLYALGGEQWAAAFLTRDLRESETDHLNEDWANLPPALPIEGGSISAHIEDLQGRFNLNNLLQGEGTDEYQLQALQRLLDSLELNPGIAQAIADWIDPDMEPRFPDGAEDGEYVSRNPPYLAANRPLASVSELRLIKGVDRDGFNRLAPYVSALPPGALVNVNTAPAPVLAALAEDLDLRAAEALIETRGFEGYADVNAFLNATGLAQDALPPAAITVSSRYFLIRIEASVGEGRAALGSVVERGEDGTHILMRSFGIDEP